MTRWISLLLGGSGGRQHLLRALAGSAGLRLIGMCFGFLVGVQLARGLGPAGYGAYGIAVAAIAILMIPTELGLPQLVMREVSSSLASNGVGATSAIVSWSVKVVVVSSLIIAGVVLCVLATDNVTMDPDVRATMLVGLLWIPVVAIGNIYGAALRGMHRVVSGQLSEFLVRPVLVSAVLFLLVQVYGRQLSAPAAMGINVLGAIVAAAISVLMLRATGGAHEANSLPDGLSFNHAIPMAMSEGMRVLGAQVGILVLAVMASHEQAGLYRVAYGIYTVTTMPSALINVACAPTIARLHTQGSGRDLARLNLWVSVFLSGASALFLLLNAAFGSSIIALLFGEEYAAASGVLMVFLAGELLASLFGHPTMVLNMMRQQKIVMVWSAVALGSNFLLTILMVHLIGYVGAAFGVVTGLVLWRVGCAAFAKTRLGVDTAFTTRLLPALEPRRIGDQ